MTYNFDEVVPRRGTNCIKYEALSQVCSNPDALPMWVADMDFRTPKFITDAIQHRLSQGILGYTCPSDYYAPTICHWIKSHHGWEIQPEMIHYVPGVVCGIYLAVQTFTEKGDKILIQQPVYHPFRLVPEGAGRQVVQTKLRRTEDGFAMDFEALERDIKGCKMMILCNPHNPGGLCWSKEDLQKVAAICAREGVVVVSDEIHCDMVLEGKHIPFASVSEEAARIAITLQAPTKTYNLPGVVASHAIVVNPELRERYYAYIDGCDMGLGNIFAFDCVIACYSDEADEWRQQMLQYVQGNIDYLDAFLKEHCPRIKAIRPKASFLVFLDCRELDLTQEQLNHFFADEACLAFNPGDMFGSEGTGYMRMNVGCTHATMQQAMAQLKQAYDRL